MRSCIAYLACMSASILPCLAETPDPPSSITPEQRRLVSDERAAEVKRRIEAARARQRVLDDQNTSLWTRWIYAVCIGCEDARTGVRIVYTNPLRVLAGVPAAMDDAGHARRRQPTPASVRQAADRAQDWARLRARDAAGPWPDAAAQGDGRLAGRRISDRLPAGGTLA